MVAPPNYAMIERALKAVAPPPSSGGYGNAPAPYIGPGPSPLVASYNDWGPYAGGRTLGTNAALPREWMTFLSGMFGPLNPIQPVPIDVPEPGEERPPPRTKQLTVGWNMPQQPGTEGIGKLATFDNLRTIADLYSVARRCIQLRKDELRSIGWDIAPTKSATKAMRGDHRAAKDFANRQAKLVKFFRRPDTNYQDFGSWFNAVTEEFFVTDALSLYMWPTRLNRGGLLGTSLGELNHIDGAMIRPLVDVHGGIPKPPNPSHQQFIFGVPRVDLMTLSAGEDLDGVDADELVAEYRADQLLYLPYSPRVWSPYGQSFLETALVPVLSGINKQTYQMNYFDSGSIPGLFVSPGDASLTAGQLKILQDALNAIAGDQAWKHRIVVLPGGSKADPMRPGPLADEFDTLVMIQVCMGFDVQPFELGVLPQLSAAAASSGAARQTVGARIDIRQRKSTIPILLFLKAAIFDRIIQDVCGQHDMEWSWQGLEEDENIAELTEALVAQVGAGLLSIDEARQILGREPWNLPITSDPGWATQWGGLVPLTGVTEATAQPLGGSPGPGGPGRGAPSKPTTIDLSTPGAVSRPGSPAAPTTVPRNRLSTGQRRSQATQVTSTQNRTGALGTPAHSGARAHPATGGPARARKAITGALTAQTLGEFQAATGAPLWASLPQVIQGEALKTSGEGDEASAVTPPGAAEDAGMTKAARELGLLRSHLRRGEQVTAWEPRFIPARLLGEIAENLAKGMTGDEACEAARLSLAASARKDGTGDGGALEPAVKQAEGYVTCGQGHRHWGAHGAAGLLIRTKAGGKKWRYLLQRRGETSDHPGTWGIPGGALHEGETPAMGAIREATEELGILPNLRPHHVVEDAHGPGPDGRNWSYHTFVCDTPEVFQPATNGTTSHETGGWAWLTARELESYPLHPGFAQSWQAVRRSQRSKTLTKDAPPFGGTPVSAEVVRRQLLANYLPDSVAWVRDTQWVLADVPLDRVDFRDDHSWAAWHEKDRVQHFARLQRAGEHIDPPVLVVEHGKGKARIVDGHHRSLGALEAHRQSERAYVGTVPEGDGRWRETHSSQRHQGSDPLNKSAETPELEATPHILGPHGLWHTPDKHVRFKQKLPNYVEHIAAALMRDQHLDESTAIAYAINAIKRWARGDLHWGKGHVSPEVRAASQRALAEWNELKRSHAG